EDGFNFHGDIARERSHADGTASSNSVLGAENLGKKLAATVDHGGMLAKMFGGIHHAKKLDEAFDAIEGPELVAERGEDRQPGLSGGGFAGAKIEILAHLAGDERLIGAKRAVT